MTKAMATAVLTGSDDPALTGALAELVGELGARLVPASEPGAADVVLMLVTSTAELQEQLVAARRLAPRAPLVVLLPFSIQPLMATARALGAAACHGLDQPTERLRAALRTIFAAIAGSDASDQPKRS